MYPSDETSNASRKPHLFIIEQPAKCGVRFRYECENRLSGPLPGASSTFSITTYPTVKLHNYHGRAKIVGK